MDDGMTRIMTTRSLFPRTNLRARRPTTNGERVNFTFDCVHLPEDFGLLHFPRHWYVDASRSNPNKHGVRRQFKGAGDRGCGALSSDGAALGTDGRTDGRNRTRAGGRIDGGREEREIVEVMIIMLTPPAARSPASAFAIRRKSQTDRPPLHCQDGMDGDCQTGNKIRSGNLGHVWELQLCVVAVASVGGGCDGTAQKWRTGCCRGLPASCEPGAQRARCGCPDSLPPSLPPALLRATMPGDEKS